MADALGDAERRGLGLMPPRATLRVVGKPNEGHPNGPVLAEVLLGDLDAERGIPAMRGGDATVYWLRAGASEQLPIEPRRLARELPGEGGGEAARPRGEAEAPPERRRPTPAEGAPEAPAE